MNKEDFEGGAGEVCGKHQRAQVSLGVGGREEATWSDEMTAPISPERAATCLLSEWISELAGDDSCLAIILSFDFWTFPPALPRFASLPPPLWKPVGPADVNGL